MHAPSFRPHVPHRHAVEPYGCDAQQIDAVLQNLISAYGKGGACATGYRRKSGR